MIDVSKRASAFLAVALMGCGGATANDSSESMTAGESTGTEVTVINEAYEEGQPASASDILSTAAAAGNFQTLISAVDAAGLRETLSGPGPFTVFAPTDEAFAALPEGAIANLLLPENREQLTAVLTYHVASGRVTSADVAGMGSVPSLQGGQLAVDTSQGVKINQANVIQADIEASNGVIHAIDAVLMPAVQ